MFREEKEVFAFHICNVVIILMVAFASQAVMRIYILGHHFPFLQNLFILMAFILPTYIAGHFAFERYKSIYRKYYAAEENGKILVLNEKYLKKKKWFRNLRHYNEMSREK
jgi:predicted membrane protein